MQRIKRSLINIFARHKVAANLLLAVMLLAGVFALLKLNTQFLPTFKVNFVTVVIVWPGANAEDVENSIINPLEQELRNLDDLKEMSSKAKLGSATIIMEFTQGSNMADALNRVREKVSLIRNLPLDAENPIITKVEPLEPVAKVAITGPKHLQELRPLVYQIERELLDRGIAKIKITGLPEQEVSVEISAAKLAELQLSLRQIAKQIREQSRDLPAGTIGKSSLAKQIRSLQQKRDIKGFRQLRIQTTNPDRNFRLSDIASVGLKAKSAQVLAYYQGQPAVILSLLRTENSNALKSAKILNTWLKTIPPTLGPNIQIHVYDQRWQYIKDRINLLLKNGAGGLILIIVILLLFLNARIAWWVVVGIPASFFAALAILYAFGGTINMVSLFAMIMTLGIIVDDTIVVSEETLSQIQKGKNVWYAVEIGAKRMLIPILASSLTTVCAFIPLLLVSGIIGTILFDIPFVVICVIIASLVECFLVLPGHLYQSLKKSNHIKQSHFRESFNKHFDHFRDHRFYNMVKTAIHYRYLTLLGAAFLFIFSIGLILSGQVKFSFFPSPEGRIVFANVQFSAGTTPERVNNFIAQLEQTLQQANNKLSAKGKSIVETVVSYKNKTIMRDQRFEASGEQSAGLEVELISPDKRSVSNQEFVKSWRDNLKLPPGIESFIITTPRAGPPGQDIDVKITGADIKSIKEASLQLQDVLKTYPGVDNIGDDLPFGQQQVIYQLNATGKALGLTIEEVGSQIRAAFSGQLVQIFHTANDEIEVNVQLPPEQQNNPNFLRRLPIITADGRRIPLDTIIKINYRKGFDILRHSNTRATVHVTAEVNRKISNTNEVIANLQKNVLPSIGEAYNVKFSFAGRAEDQQETLRDMFYGLMLGLILIYIILAWVFSSYTWPLIILSVIPLGLTGAILGHWIMHMDLTVLSLFGLFGLSGIVVNDSIILLSTYKRLRKEEASIRVAIIKSACQRLRAVLLTSLTTIAGLTPLLFETSLQAQFLIPMVVSITFGLAYATILILIVTPAMLSVYENLFWRGR